MFGNWNRAAVHYCECVFIPLVCFANVWLRGICNSFAVVPGEIISIFNNRLFKLVCNLLWENITPAIQTNCNVYMAGEIVRYMRVLILVFVEEEVFFGGVVGPDVFDAFVSVAFVFDFLEVFDYFERGAATLGVVDEFVFGCRPGSIFEFRCEFKCPIHNFFILVVNGFRKLPQR